MMADRVSRPPVMVFSGEFWRGSSGLGLAQGFRKLGWVVQEIDLSRTFGGLASSIALRVSRRVLAAPLAREFERELRAAITALKPDVFFSIKGTRITSDLLRWIGERGIRRAMFYPDFHFDHSGVSLDDFALYDEIFTSKSFHVEFLEQTVGSSKVHYVPHGYSDDVHWPVLGYVSENSYEADVQHIGAHSSHKQGWIEAVAAGVPDSSVRLVGARWKMAIDGRNRGNIRVADSVYDAAYSRALQSGRINISIMMGPHGSGWEDKVSTRTFEIAACGAFQLHVDSEELREFFTPGKDLDVFRTPDELCDKVSFYLRRPELRARMIASSHARCVPAHGYASRAAVMNRILMQGRFQAHLA